MKTTLHIIENGLLFLKSRLFLFILGFAIGLAIGYLLFKGKNTKERIIYIEQGKYIKKNEKERIDSLNGDSLQYEFNKVFGQ